eukprot:3286627-Rhodomonas_salina.2
MACVIMRACLTQGECRLHTCVSCCLRWDSESVEVHAMRVREIRGSTESRKGLSKNVQECSSYRQLRADQISIEL